MLLKMELKIGPSEIGLWLNASIKSFFTTSLQNCPPQAIDKDENDTFSTVYYEIIAVDPPYLVNRETGEVTTADTFTGRSGETDKFTVVAYDNRGNEPSFTSTAILTVSTSEKHGILPGSDLWCCDIPAGAGVQGV